MSSSRLILVILGLIIIILIVFSSNRIGTYLKSRFAKYFPSVQTAKLSVSPTPSIKLSITPSQITQYNSPSIQYSNTPANTSEIPATGPNEIVIALLVTSGSLGFFIRKKGK